jgi:N-acetylmuramoyl-L-alanine amidase
MRLYSVIVQLAAYLLLAGGFLSATETDRRIVVMIDAGHGGIDAGALGPKVTPGKKGGAIPSRLMEKKVALQMAKLLGSQLENKGYVVRYTRTDDVFVPLPDRARAANEAGADVFVSLHLNSNSKKSARGSEVYFLSLGPVDSDMQELADAENELENMDSEIDDTDFLAGMLDDLAQEAYLLESERMAVSIQYELNRLAGVRERGVKQAPFAVLRRAAMPAVLVETAFISNPDEAAKLRDPAFLKSATQAIAKGIQHYIESSGNSRIWRKPAS